jgi:hypothetical protein
MSTCSRKLMYIGCSANHRLYISIPNQVMLYNQIALNRYKLRRSASPVNPQFHYAQHKLHTCALMIIFTARTLLLSIYNLFFLWLLQALID